MNLKAISSIALYYFNFIFLLSASDTTAQLVNKAKSENRTQASHNVVREVDFKKDRTRAKAIKAQLDAKRTSVQKRATDVLTFKPLVIMKISWRV